ncbi:MAG TPA: methyltransferase domain-containing protein [Steroidobacteraceae bacterium]|nr:methyltransferase domain-containing protein [Steroidobacteraceae bacterium]
MAERDYLLGTHDAELERLGLQHRLWRARVLEAWRRARLGPGQTVLDVGAGPGYAALDLAEIVGRSGRVVALERSRRFLDALVARAAARGLAQLEVRETDVVSGEFGVAGADAAWCRWLLCFVSDPRAVLARIRAALRPGGVAVFHEYLDYRAWALSPPCPPHERFVGQVIASWRAEGGEPDVGRSLLGQLIEAGFRIEGTRLHVEFIAPDDPFWAWPVAYVEVGSARFVELGLMSAPEAHELIAAVRAAEARPETRMLTPPVLEVIARVP